MTLQDILKHVFCDKDLTDEVNSYSVSHTNTDNYTIETDKLTIQVTKKCS